MSVHVPVMLTEVVEGLQAKRGGRFLDCTFGGGGHTRGILNASELSHVVAIDRDRNALERAEAWRASFGERLQLVRAPFSDLERVVGLDGSTFSNDHRFDGILADLGVSTDQLREGRGFSFSDQDSLDMRMDQSSGMSVAEFLNAAHVEEIFLALAKGGVGTSARPLARALVKARPFVSAAELGEFIKRSGLGKNPKAKVHPATVVFQALRMHVNREREEIEELLKIAPKIAKKGGRLAVITFHSIEDQLVTKTMRDWQSRGSVPAGWRGPPPEAALGTLISRKPIEPSDEEIQRNPASRSARLRVFEFE